MAEFDYKQRPFSKKLTDEEYDRAVGRAPEVLLCPFTENPSINPHGCYVSDDAEDGPSPNCWVVHGRTCPRAK